MSGDKLLLDTNVILYLLGDEDIEDKFSEKQLAISVITEVELLSYPKISVQEEQIILSFLDIVKRIPFDESIQKETIYLRRKYKMNLPDAIICATAKAYGLILVTNDIALHTVQELKVMGLDSL